MFEHEKTKERVLTKQEIHEILMDFGKNGKRQYNERTYSPIHKAAGRPASVQNGGLEVILYGGFPLTFFCSAGNGR